MQPIGFYLGLCTYLNLAMPPYIRFYLDQRSFTVVNSTLYVFIRHYMYCKSAVLNHKAL